MKQKESMKEAISVEQVDWSSLNKILSDTTRRSILELLKEKDAISYTEIMSILRVTNTGRLNYHLKALTGLISKDDQGKYHLTERGQLAVNLLQTFPEKVQAENVLFIKKRSLKVALAAILILIGVFLIFFALLFSFTAIIGAVGPLSGTFSDRAIPQNTTIYLTDLVVQNNAPQFNIKWSASNPIVVYVLNSTQYNALQLQQNTTYFLANFTGMPLTYGSQYDLQSSSVSLTLSQGQYWLYAWSANNTTLDSSLSLAQQPYQAGGFSLPVAYLIVAVIIALGIFVIALAILILTRRVWR